MVGVLKTNGSQEVNLILGHTLFKKNVLYVIKITKNEIDMTDRIRKAEASIT